MKRHAYRPTSIERYDKMMKAIEPKKGYKAAYCRKPRPFEDNLTFSKKMLPLLETILTEDEIRALRTFQIDN